MRHGASEGDDQSLEIAPTAYAKAVGSRLRAVRTEMHLSLQRVDALSEGEFRTSVLGAYERGDRAISLPRLQRLATLYDVPLERFLPRDGAGERDEAITRVAIRGAGQDRDQDEPRPFADKVTIDLVRLKTIDGPNATCSSPTWRRSRPCGELRGSVITIRGEDLRVISCLVGLTPDDMNRRLEELGLRAGPTEHGSSQSRRAS